MERLWTLERMAQFMGISLSQVAKIEKGQARPTPLTLAKISRALALPLTDLIVPTVQSLRSRPKTGGRPIRALQSPGTKPRRSGRPVSAPPKSTESKGDVDV